MPLPTADELWWARLRRRLRWAPNVPRAQRRWDCEELPGGGYRLVRDETTRLLDELETALEAARDDVGPALVALDRLAEHVGMESRPRWSPMPTRLERQRRFRELHRALMAGARRDVDLALKGGTLVAVGSKRSELARMLGVHARDIALPLEGSSA